MKLSLFIKRDSREEKIWEDEIDESASNPKKFQIYDEEFFQSDEFRFDLTDGSRSTWKVKEGENGSSKSLPMKKFKQLFDGEYCGNTQFDFYKDKDKDKKFSIEIYIFPTKILNSHFQQMVKDIYTLFPNIINRGLVKHDFLLQILNKTNQPDHQIIILKKLIDRFIHHIQSIIRKPLVKSNMIFEPFNKNSKINIPILKTIYKKGCNAYNYKTQIQNTLLVPSVNIKPEIKSLKNISLCFLFLIGKVDKLLKFMEENKYGKEDIDNLEFARTKLKGIHNLFMSFFKLPINRKNNKKIPSPTWIESKNKNYFSIRRIIKDFDYSYAIPNVLEIGDRNLTKISELYEYWLFMKFYNSLESDITRIKYLKKPNKPEMRGEINDYHFDIIKERNIELAKGKTVGLINSPKNLITPDLSIYFKINEEIKKIFIFDAKYMPERKMVDEMKKCIKKGYKSIGNVENGDTINLVNHFWLLYPGLLNGNEFTSNIVYFEKGCYFDGDYRMTSGWLPLRPQYGDAEKGEYNVDTVLNTFLTKLFKIEGIIK